ncbi:MAG TPA: cysteine desulfurase [Acidobacteriota bacterium]|nr:cysteine desulfurase [Acidobacteriota bacterium]
MMTNAEIVTASGLNGPFDPGRVRLDFPIFRELVNGKPLIYLDNAATTQKPQAVLDAISDYYTHRCSSVHRGVYFLSEQATASFEDARRIICTFINAASPREIVFVRGATEAINLVSQTYGRTHIGTGDEILISALEHHSDIVPWQILCQEKGAKLRVVPVTPAGEFDFDQYQMLLGPKTRLVAVTHVSNALGTVNPVEKIIRLAHQQNTPVLVDGAQSIPHMSVDVQSLDCDFLAFSGHKMYGPTGIGVLYGKERLLDDMPPYHGGGDMIRSVTFEKTVYAELPYKFEAGTPNVAGAIGLGAAVEYVRSIGMQNIFSHEQALLAYGALALEKVDRLRIIGKAKEKAGVISFVLDSVHPHDIGTILDAQGIAIRTGTLCAQPVMDFFKIPATARISFGVYNTRDDIDALLEGLLRVKEVFC